jgi:hypothetical protein
MSQQGLQRASQLLQVIGTQLPSIAQASEMNVDLRQFIYGALLRSGVQPTSEIESFVSALVELIGPGPAAPA